MAVGKIASSTANYSTLGKTSPKNAANGFTPYYQGPGYEFINCEVFAPSVNLGVSVINTVAPATQGYTSYTQGPGIEGGVGYAPNFTENNITIVKPDALPTNPAFADGRSFGRYETNFLEMARGLSSSCIVGSDLFTVQDYYEGGLNTPTANYVTFEDPINIFGQQNFVGATATGYGYPYQEIRINNVFGTNNGNVPKRGDGNFAFTYPDYGYSLAPGTRLWDIAIFGSNNLNGLIATGEGNQIRESVVVGNRNFDGIMDTSAYGYRQLVGNGLRSGKCTAVSNMVIVGNSNRFGSQKTENNYDGTYGQWPTVSMSEGIIIGDSTFDGKMTNFIAAGSGDQSSNNRGFSNNILLGTDKAQYKLRKKYENAPGSPFSQPDATFYNIVIGGRNTSYKSFDASNSQKNTAIGHGIFGYNLSGDGYETNGFSNLDKNVVIGDSAISRHGISANNVTTQKNVVIGVDAQTLSTGLDNCTIIGYDAEASTTNAANEITLGNGSISTLRCNVTSITSLSDVRDKKDVEDANIGLDFINDLRPVKFVWDTRDGAKKDIKEVGFIAQELDEVQQKHGVEDHLQLVLKNNPDKLEASQGKLIPILVQAIKDLKKELDELKKD